MHEHHDGPGSPPADRRRLNAYRDRCSEELFHHHGGYQWCGHCHWVDTTLIRHLEKNELDDTHEQGMLSYYRDRYISYVHKNDKPCPSCGTYACSAMQNSIATLRRNRKRFTHLLRSAEEWCSRHTLQRTKKELSQ